MFAYVGRFVFLDSESDQDLLKAGVNIGYLLESVV